MGLLQGWMRRTVPPRVIVCSERAFEALPRFDLLARHVSALSLRRSSLAALNIALNMVLCLCAVWEDTPCSPRPERPPHPLEKDFYTLSAFSIETPRVSGIPPEGKRYAYSVDAAPAPSTFTAQAASLLGRRLSRPDCRSRCGLCPATARWTGGYRSDMTYRQWRRISPPPGKMETYPANGWKSRARVQ